MLPTPTSWATYYPTLAGSEGVAEPPAAWHRTIPETLVRCLWFDQRWRPATLHTLEGRAITVHTPGRWNVQAGPDFQQAHIELVGGVHYRGDVEIHRYASGWTAHRHHLDPRYNNVILHVFLWNDRQTLEAHRADGQALPQVALADYLPRPLADYQAEISLEEYPYKMDHGYGQCYASLQTRPPQEAQDFLNRAGDTRLQQRAWRWSHRIDEVGLAQVMYEAILRSLGATGYRQRFQELARLLSWSDVQHCLDSVPSAQRGLAAEALLFGLAGMLQDTASDHPATDTTTLHYCTQLQAFWQHFPPALRQRAWHHVNWRQPGVRPANTPERRLAGMAQVLAHYDNTTLFDIALATMQSLQNHPTPRQARQSCSMLAALLQVPGMSYWTQRAVWGGHPTKPQRLIGAQRALTVVVDAILPVLFMDAQRRTDRALRTKLLAVYGAAPRLPDNHLLRYMRHRALGNHPALLALLTGARQQQGLLQMFADFCSNDEGNCQGCAFPLV